MSSSTALGRVSESLLNLLTAEMALRPEVAVTVLAPDESHSANRRVNLYLYRVRQNAEASQMDWQVKPGNSSRLTPPPLSLNLYYLLTPYAANDPSLGNTTTHEILGEAMRVFEEFPVIPEPYLAGDLAGSPEQIKIIHHGINMEELSQVWGTFSQPYRLSVLYEISVVQLDLSAAAEKPMPQRVREIGVPGVQASHNPPVVEAIEPAAGPAGSTVTFLGSHLEGWKAWVRMLRREVASGVEITGDSFQVTLPGDLEPGFHDLRLDVSNLFRRTFLFEVTS